MQSNRRLTWCLSTAALAGAGAALLSAAAGAGGCEQRVISARGPGADTVETSAPFYDPPAWEKKVFGDPNPPKRRN